MKTSRENWKVNILKIDKSCALNAINWFDSAMKNRSHNRKESRLSSVWGSWLVGGGTRWERDGEILSFLSAPPPSRHHYFFFIFRKNTNNGLRLLKNSTYGSAPIKLSSCFCSQDISHFYMILSSGSVGGGLWRVRQRLVREWDQNKKVFFLSFAIILAGVVIKHFRITFRFGLED